MVYAHKIYEEEGGDLSVVTAAILFHDCINIPKEDPNAKQAAHLSAIEAEKELLKIKDFPKEKIPLVKICINEHSFSKGITPTILESKIVQDADRLESTGIISLMRTFASSGTMGSTNI